ncbi:MAG: FAD binding domain-containing protein [Nannocystaceae bacterium]|nr:FAD binding domain-containing protein [Nannocystaceae bacterium]
MRGIVSDHELTSPSTLQETLALLSDDPGEVRPIAGGTDVMVELAAGVLRHRRWVNIWQHDELRGIGVGEDTITVRALTTYSEVRAHDVLSREFPMLGQAAAESGAWAIQNRGTIGGNIVNASPAADTPPALLVYDAKLILLSSRGERVVPYRDFHTGYKQMQREPDELLSGVVLPRDPWLVGPDSRALQRYRKVGTRKAQAISKVCLAALGVVEQGKVVVFRLAFGSVAAVPLACTAAEAVAVGSAADATLADRVAAALTGQVLPLDDVRSTARYRARVAENLAREFATDLANGLTGFAR